MEFVADLHVHSKYSRATARNLDLEHLYQAARMKGVNVVGTGDFTFPAWIEEISEKLEPAEPGLFSLKPEIARQIDARIPPSCQGQVRFILQTEISNIYKKNGKVRKNHNLIFFPDLDSVKKLNLRLGQIGNITSDGRPILGLDAADLLEIMLETNDQGFFVPAHIWTPWFSMFGSKSGFDSMEECFGSLVSHIFAVETGLSSDPPMNHRVKNLDNVRLISNSDAHSPGYLGRNATVFQTDMDYFSLRKALETGDHQQFQGTYDMYPHQGKYHYDGHRKCNICLNPEQTMACQSICPECGRPLTLGVLHRVQELADRPEGFVAENRHGYEYIVPLRDILSEICGVGPGTKKVTGWYEKAIADIGPELSVLVKTPVEKIARANIPLLARAIEKIRTKRIHVDPGYDGEYGKVRIFSREERQELEDHTGSLFSQTAMPAPQKNTPRKAVSTQEIPVKKNALPIKKTQKSEKPQETDKDLITSLNEDQKKAVFSRARAIIIQAGPGTGKTRTLTAKIAWLISEQKILPENILALTFTRKAAEELTQRIQRFLPENNGNVTATTFHSFCLQILRTHAESDIRPMDPVTKNLLLKQALKQAKEKTTTRNVKLLDAYISQCKQRSQEPGEQDRTNDAENVSFKEIQNLSLACQEYETLCQQEALIDFEGIIFACIKYLNAHPETLCLLQKQFSHIFVDEFQDVNLAQYELVNMLADHGHILVIGDQDQSIYGFRGSDSRYFSQFEHQYPDCEKIVLRQNYRSTQTILDASWQMISRTTGNTPDSDNLHTRIFSNTNQGQQILIQSYPSDTAEITGIGKMIESLIGGLSFFSFDARDVRKDTGHEYSFQDIAVLCRTKKQCQAFAAVFDKHGIPFQNADYQNNLSQEGIDLILAGMNLFVEENSERTTDRIPDIFRHHPELHKTIQSFISEQPRSSSLNLLTAFPRVLRLTSETTDKQWFQDTYDRLTSLADIFPDPLEFMDNLALAQDQDALSQKMEKVALMTMHTAKGLEFPVVFVAGCENGLIPFDRGTIQSPTDMEEEKRLFYVAMTRAKDLLCLTHADKRQIYGKVQKQEKSCFLQTIEKELTRNEKVGKGAKRKTVKPSGHVQMELF